VRGGVSERPKEHASKACEVQASVGSNPTATAIRIRENADSAAKGEPALRRLVSVLVSVGLGIAVSSHLMRGFA